MSNIIDFEFQKSKRDCTQSDDNTLEQMQNIRDQLTLFSRSFDRLNEALSNFESQVNKFSSRLERLEKGLKIEN